MPPNKRRKPVKAYKNDVFLNSPDARIIRIMCEFVEPLRRFKKQNVHDTIVFFGSSRAVPLQMAQRSLNQLKKRLGRSRTPSAQGKLRDAEAQVALARYFKEAEDLAYRLTRWSKALGGGKRFIICSGGGPGIMEAANQGAARAKGRSLGLNISIAHEQASNPYVSDALNFEFHYFFMRKFWFTYMAKAMVFFPGGFGTLDEMMEILTLVQTRKVTKPMPIVLYGREYWNDVLDLENLMLKGTIDAQDIDLYRWCNSPEEAFNYLKDELTRLYLD
ncbi:LOG family protein [Acidobacteriota bacterium]